MNPLSWFKKEGGESLRDVRERALKLELSTLKLEIELFRSREEFALDALRFYARLQMPKPYTGEVASRALRLMGRPIDG